MYILVYMTLYTSEVLGFWVLGGFGYRPVLVMVGILTKMVTMVVTIMVMIMRMTMLLLLLLIAAVLSGAGKDLSFVRASRFVFGSSWVAESLPDPASRQYAQGSGLLQFRETEVVVG